MKLRLSHPRASISFALAIAVTTVFTLHSFAAPDAARLAAEPIFAEDCTGTLTISGGQVTINGNAAQTGATVMSGSVVATGSNGKAIIDFNAIGRVELGENTAVTLTCSGGLLEIRSSCPKTEIKVTRGTVDVKSPRTETLTAGKEEKYDNGFAATVTGSVELKIECGGRRVGKFTPGLLGLLALIGVGAGVAAGVAAGNGDSVSPSSPIR